MLGSSVRRTGRSSYEKEMTAEHRPGRPSKVDTAVLGEALLLVPDKRPSQLTAKDTYTVVTESTQVKQPQRTSATPDPLAAPRFLKTLKRSNFVIANHAKEIQPTILPSKLQAAPLGEGGYINAIG